MLPTLSDPGNFFFWSWQSDTPKYLMELVIHRRAALGITSLGLQAQTEESIGFKRYFKGRRDISLRQAREMLTEWL